MSIDFTPGIINTYHGDIYNCTTNTDNAKTPDTPKWPCDNWEEQQPINSTFSGEGYISDVAKTRELALSLDAYPDFVISNLRW